MDASILDEVAFAHDEGSVLSVCISREEKIWLVLWLSMYLVILAMLLDELSDLLMGGRGKWRISKMYVF